MSAEVLIMSWSRRAGKEMRLPAFHWRMLRVGLEVVGVVGGVRARMLSGGVAAGGASALGVSHVIKTGNHVLQSRRLVVESREETGVLVLSLCHEALHALNHGFGELLMRFL